MFCGFFFSCTIKPIKEQKMTLEEAVKVIQAAERARQGRLRAKLNKESRNMKWMERTEEPGAEVAEAAAICIQKVSKNQHFCVWLLFYSESFGRVLYTGLAGLRTEEEDQDSARGRNDPSRNGE